ncbi:MAG: tripartite tricarboxylate transporter substrate binding protein [Paracoccus sp. (in: a-proteobacteria)]|uniref:tripartite tricarboxylate transporter substrate binding protein n=1 Tax=Paracoccus sp. TaxID=267 RepID=UPI002E8C6C6F|nr:tripartite tricarboxylate transporter substrate binding protein [Pseudomonadota bacterium]
MKKIAIAFILTLAGAMPALAEYPEKPVEIIVGYAAGGGTDVMARTIAQFLEAELGGSVVVRNEPGAGGQIGFTNTAAAKPDGYTLGTFNLPAAFALTLDREADYGTDSFTYLANFVDDPNTVVVAADSPYQTLDDLLTAATEAPGTITMGLSSLGGNDHFAAIMLQDETEAEAEFTLVPFKGAALARTALMGGHIAAGTMALSQTTGFENEMRVLAVLSDERSEFAPDVPTAAEQGIDIRMSSLRGLVAPAGLEPQVQETLEAALMRVNETPEFQAMMASQGNPMSYVSGEGYADIAQQQADIAAEIWKNTPWQ